MESKKIKLKAVVGATELTAGSMKEIDGQKTEKTERTEIEEIEDKIEIDTKNKTIGVEIGMQIAIQDLPLFVKETKLKRNVLGGPNITKVL